MEIAVIGGTGDEGFGLTLRLARAGNRVTIGSRIAEKGSAVADTAREAGVDDYKVVVNVGPGAGQTVFHLHWHVLGGQIRGLAA